MEEPSHPAFPGRRVENFVRKPGQGHPYPSGINIMGREKNPIITLNYDQQRLKWGNKRVHTAVGSRHYFHDHGAESFLPTPAAAATPEKKTFMDHHGAWTWLDLTRRWMLKFPHAASSIYTLHVPLYGSARYAQIRPTPTYIWVIQENKEKQKTILEATSLTFGSRRTPGSKSNTEISVSSFLKENIEPTRPIPCFD